MQADSLAVKERIFIWILQLFRCHVLTNPLANCFAYHPDVNTAFSMSHCYFIAQFLTFEFLLIQLN